MSNLGFARRFTRSVAALASLLVSSHSALATPEFADASESTLGKNIVTIDAADAFIPGPEDAAYWVLPNAVNDIPVKLDTPSIGTGQVSFVTLLSPGIGTILFSAGQQFASVEVEFPSTGFTTLYPGWEAQWAYFALTAPGGGLVRGIPDVLYFAQVRETGLRSGKGDCVYCIWGALLSFLNISGGFVCGALEEATGPTVSEVAATRAGASSVTILQRYRDEILAATPEGQFYTGLYSQHSLDLMRAIVAAPSLTARLFKAQDAWVDGFEALVDGQGATYVVTQPMEDDLNSLLDTFQSAGSPALQQMLTFERGRLQLDEIAGLTMSQYQTQIETLGGTSAVEPMSWGRVKSLYR